MTRPAVAIAILALSASVAAAAPGDYAAGSERVEDFAALIPEDRAEAPEPAAASELLVERITTAVPWPRGMVFIDGDLVVLARGRHRRAGGIDPHIEDHAGSLFAVDPEIAEPVLPGERASQKIRQNARLLAAPTDPPFHLYDRSRAPLESALIDRPYCTLIHDSLSRNLFICGYSGVDLPGARFRKNATDSILRYDMRSARWHPVELHDPTVVPPGAQTTVVPNRYYPHHDPTRNPPPHGWLNGADGGCVAGDSLYVAAKDNHLVVQYDLAGVRSDPNAPSPDSRPVLGRTVLVRHPGGQREMEVLGPSTVATHGGHLYVGYRTSSVVLRFALDQRGDLVQPPVGELIAVFEPWDQEARRSANLIDLAFNGRGELFVSCATEGRIWNVGHPDPGRPFYGDGRSPRPTTAPPWADLPALLGKRTGCGNIVFDDRDRLYVCSGANDTGSEMLCGVVYRVTPLEQ